MPLIPGIMLALVLALSTAGATELPAKAPLFQFEQQAQKHCPADTVVWLNRDAGTYIGRGQHWYGRTKNGAYICKKEGERAGYRAAKGG